jgi:CheY-like chemotaxis protein
MKILIVDDHVLIREALRGVLSELKKEATVLEASSSHQAMQQIEANPDLELILLDLNLPDRDGFEILAEVRTRKPAGPYRQDDGAMAYLHDGVRPVP